MTQNWNFYHKFIYFFPLKFQSLFFVFPFSPPSSFSVNDRRFKEQGNAHLSCIYLKWNICLSFDLVNHTLDLFQMKEEVFISLYIFCIKNSFPLLTPWEVWRKVPTRCTLRKGILMLEVSHSLLYSSIRAALLPFPSSHDHGLGLHVTLDPLQSPPLCFQQWHHTPATRVGINHNAIGSWE